MDTHVIASLGTNPARRVVATVLITALGLLLIGLGVLRASGPLQQVFLIGLGGGFLWLMLKLRAASTLRIVLTSEGLFDSQGQRLVAIEDIAKIDRGTFAFKPTNGIILHLHNAGPRGWAPGLWWRVGRSFGIGGMVPKAEARFMADAITSMLSEKADLS